jgi:ABC-type amino acid transport substrate-binding protein
MRRALLAAALVAALAAAAGAETARVGVRADAKPFAYRADDGSYAGFLVDICLAGLARAGYEPEFVEVGAADRFDRLGPGPEGLDLLCDPTTITLERAARWEFTPIVFVANGAYLRRAAPLPLAEAARAAHGCPPAGEVYGVGWLRGTTSEADGDALGEVIGLEGSAQVCVIPVDSHVEGVGALCEPAGGISYYFADADILAAYLAERQADGGCEARFVEGFSTYEPYALALGARDPAFRRRFQAGFYEIFAGGGAREAFARHFGAREPSPPLETLFRMYTLPPGEPTPGR